MDLTQMQTLLQGGPTAIGAYAIVFATKKWVPARWRSAVAMGAGLVLYVGYAAATGGDIVQALQIGLSGGLAATGMHEIITKGLKDK